MQLSVHPSGVAAIVWLEGSVLVAPQLRLIMQGFLGSSTEWTLPRLLAERFELIGSIELRVVTDPDGGVQVVWDTELGELWSIRAVIEPQ